MIQYNSGDPKRIQHFIKVHSFARLIGSQEALDEAELFTLEAAAIVHDIGIRLCEEKYGNCSGKLQEKEGPAIAAAMLEKLYFEKNVIDRVCWLVGHHHTYSNIDSLDYQILVEADFLVNLYEDQLPQDACRAALDNIFRTESGIRLCRTMFSL
jgi:hypothetical protein